MDRRAISGSAGDPRLGWDPDPASAHAQRALHPGQQRVWQECRERIAGQRSGPWVVLVQSIDQQHEPLATRHQRALGRALDEMPPADRLALLARVRAMTVPEAVDYVRATFAQASATGPAMTSKAGFIEVARPPAWTTRHRSGDIEEACGILLAGRRRRYAKYVRNRRGGSRSGPPRSSPAVTPLAPRARRCRLPQMSRADFARGVAVGEAGFLVSPRG